VFSCSVHSRNRTDPRLLWLYCSGGIFTLFHYCGFMWMLMEGILQYLRFVKVLGTYIPHFILKTAVPTWGEITLLYLFHYRIKRHFSEWKFMSS